MKILRKAILGLLICGVFVLPSFAADDASAPTRSPDDLAYLQRMNSAIDAMIAKYSTIPKKPVLFSTNMLFAYGATIKAAPDNVLLAYADAVKDVGANRIDLNPSIASLTDPAALAKYDVLIAHIRKLGLQVGINPEWEPPVDNALKTFAQYKDAAVKGEALFAARYKPDYVAVIHEPTTMDARRTQGFTKHATPEEWGDFVSATAKAIKAASPTTRVGAGAFSGDGSEISFLSKTATPPPPNFFQEQIVYRVFVETPELDFVTVDVYNAAPRAMTILDQMVETAHAAKKSVYIEETWRPHYLPSRVPAGSSGAPPGFLENSSVKGVGNSMFEPVDIKWMKAMALYAATHDMEAVTPFRSTCFFLYVDSGPDNGNFGPYNQMVMQSIIKGERTDTFRAYQELTKELGKH